MSHVPRRKGESGFHHIVTKGDGSQVIFESDRDRERYLKELVQALRDHDVRLHAYCLMSNHVHLLAEDRKDNLSAFMKQLNERYAMYYRRTTGRVGHVFQRPFWSEPVETDERFLCTVRYIHANPQVAGICPFDRYRWSSYRAHLGEPSFVEVEFTADMIGGIEQFEVFSASGPKTTKPFPESRLHGHLSYDELLRVAKATVGEDVLNSLREMDPSERVAPIRALKGAGLSGREIARFTGLGRRSVQAALSDDA